MGITKKALVYTSVTRLIVIRFGLTSLFFNAFYWRGNTQRQDQKTGSYTPANWPAILLCIFLAETMAFTTQLRSKAAFLISLCVINDAF